MHTASKSEFEIHDPARSGVEPGGKTVVLGDIGAALRLLAAVEEAPVLYLTVAVDAAENGLLTNRSDIIAGRSELEEPAWFVSASTLEVRVETQGGVRADNQKPPPSASSSLR